jgi:hypothetical protein
MFDKILIANRGARAPGAGVRSCAQHVVRTPNRIERAARGGFTAGEAHV